MTSSLRASDSTQARSSRPVAGRVARALADLGRHLLIGPLRAAGILAHSMVRPGVETRAPGALGSSRVLLFTSLYSVDFILQDLQLARYLRRRGQEATVLWSGDAFVPVHFTQVTNGYRNHEWAPGPGILLERLLRLVSAVTVLPIFHLVARVYARRFGIRLQRLDRRQLSASEVQRAFDDPELQSFLAADYLATHVDASFIRRFRGEPFRKGDPEHKRVRARLEESAREMAVLAHAVTTRSSYDVAIFSNPFYVNWGVAFDWFRHHTAIRTKFIAHNGPPYDSLSSYEESPFTAKMQREFERFLETVDPATYREDVIAEVEAKHRPESLDGVPVPAGRHVVALYPNILWDGLTGHEPALFENVLDWITSTVRHCREQSIGVYLKLHPVATEPHVTNFLPADVLEHCVVLHRESSYDLAATVAMNVVFNGTLAFELPILGLPVLSLSDSHYVDKRVCHTPATRAEYFDLLDRAPDEDVQRLVASSRYREPAIRYYRFRITWMWFELPFWSTTFVPSDGRAVDVDREALERLLN